LRAALLIGAAAGALCLIGSGRALSQPEAVDMELCLAADGSGSIADEEFQFQRSGYAAAQATRACSTSSVPGSMGGSRSP
jgi:hypothetical protein